MKESSYNASIDDILDDFTYALFKLRLLSYSVEISLYHDLQDYWNEVSAWQKKVSKC